MGSENTGARLRAARMRQGLSLRSVAQAVGLSPSLVSKVETGKTQPSVSTLFALASHLGLRVDDVIGGAGGTSGRQPAAHAVPSRPKVQRAGENPSLDMENGVRWERLAMSSTGSADPILVTYAPGASSSVEGRLMRHAGSEYAYIITGELTLQINFDVVVLKPGDSVHFDSVLPHMYSNHGEVPATGVWFEVGRRENDLEDGPLASDAHSSAMGRLRAMDVL
jgi:transcriptional regulator with XRE-family HTH domain